MYVLYQALHSIVSNRYSLVQPDYSSLEDDYHGTIVTCLQAYFQGKSKSFFYSGKAEHHLEVLRVLEKAQPNGHWLLIGLGGGVLTTKLLRAFPKVRQST